MKNDFTAIGKEFFFFDFNNRVIKGLHSPAKATRFRTKKEANKALEECYADRLGNKAVVISGEPKALESEFNDWIENGAVYRNLPMRNEFSRPYNGEDGLTVLQWWANYHKNEGSISYEDYKTWPKPNKFYECISEVVRMVNSRYDYMAPTAAMRISPNCDFETFAKEFEIAKSISEYKVDGLYKMDIKENTLSEFGVYHLDYNDDSYHIMFNGRVSKSFEDLKSLFKYWQKRHPCSVNF
jgi:hypothetical protein